MDSAIELSRCLLCSSGRISYEIIQKALMAGIAVVMGVGAPSSLAVSLATDFNVTLLALPATADLMFIVALSDY